MSFFGRKKNRAPQTLFLKPRRSRIFRRAVREDAPRAERKFSPWTVGYAFLWTVFFSAVVFALFFSSFLRVDRKAIAPTKAVPEAGVSAVVDGFLSGKSLGIFPNDTLLVALFRKRTLERELLAQFPIFRTVRISFLFPRTVSISSEERKITITLCSGGPCFFVDEHGIAFDGAPAPLDVNDPDAPLAVIDQSAKPVSLRDAVFSEEFFAALLPVRRRLFDELGIATSNIAETPSRLSDELRFLTSEGWELRMSSAVPTEKSLRALRLLFAKTLSDGDRSALDYIDLRTENKIFYLLKGGEPKEGDQTPSETDTGKKGKK